MLPPYDTRETLASLATLIDRYQPETVIALGDSLHDAGAAARMDGATSRHCRFCRRIADWIWITGNHDPEIDSDACRTRRC